MKKGISSPQVILRLFFNSETLYMWMCEPETPIDQIVDIEEDEFIEVEWMGCEFVTIGDKKQPLHLVRAVRALNSSGSISIIQPFYGWIPHMEIGFFSYDTDHVTVTSINETMSLIDMKIAFMSE